MTKQKHRVFVLGAGFSKSAGLPLADELWHQILAQAKLLWGRASMLNDDLDTYIAFRRECDGIELTKDTLNFEQFLGFLDIEHHLGLRGSDTWSKDGNEGQVVVKFLIGKLLAKYMPPADHIPELYLEFALRLQPNDHVLTFNYDVLLERALDVVGKPYRLFPSRFESVSRNSGVLDTSKEEVKVLKLHGSIDWFDKSSQLEMERIHKEMGIQEPPQHIIFNGTTDWGLSKIVDGPRYDDDILLNMYRVTNIEDLYKQNLLFLATPWILTPSTSKIVYANQLSDFWSGLGVSGGTNFGMAIIGYSLPVHDIYARQAIYSLVRNYQNVYWDEEIFGLRKTPLVLVDYRPTRESFEEFKRSYRFVDFDKAELFMDGFNLEAIDSIFA